MSNFMIIFWIVLGFGLLILIYSKSNTTLNSGNLTIPKISIPSWIKNLWLPLFGAALAYWLLSGHEIPTDWDSWSEYPKWVIALLIGVVIYILVYALPRTVLVVGLIIAFILYLMFGGENSIFASKTTETRQLYHFSQHGNEVRIYIPRGRTPHFYPKGGPTKNCPPEGQCYTDTPGIDTYPSVTSNTGIWIIAKASQETTGVEVWLE